jgi:hypothetical protein
MGNEEEIIVVATMEYYSETLEQKMEKNKGK